MAAQLWRPDWDMLGLDGALQGAGLGDCAERGGSGWDKLSSTLERGAGSPLEGWKGEAGKGRVWSTEKSEGSGAVGLSTKHPCVRWPCPWEAV